MRLPALGILLGAVLLCALLAATAQARNLYVSSGGKVWVIDTGSAAVVGQPIGSGSGAGAIAISPDGTRAYVANNGANRVFVIDTATNSIVGNPISVGSSPLGLALSPDGSRLYVPNYNEESVGVVDTATGALVGSPIAVGKEPEGVALTPDGSRAYVTNTGAGSVSVIDTATAKTIGLPIPVGTSPIGITISADGTRAYVSNFGSNSVSVIDTATNMTVGLPIPVVGPNPLSLAVTPDGSRVYVGNFNGKTVSVIDTATSKEVGTAIETGMQPRTVSTSPDGAKVYVGNAGANNVSVVGTATNSVLGSAIGVGNFPQGAAIVPDQPPRAAFSAPPRVRPGVPFELNGSASSDPDGTIARYAWNFGDGQSDPSGAASPSHTYSNPGNYLVQLTLTDNEGCSTALVYTGQTASCNGSALATRTATVNVSYPGVDLRCPRRAEGRCRFTVRALTKRKRGKALSLLARGNAKPGSSAALTLKPTRPYAARLGAAGKVLARVTVKTGGDTETGFRVLPIVR